jgi:hypothetical protein
VTTDPEPQHTFLAIDPYNTMAQSDTRGPVSADFLEVQ